MEGLEKFKSFVSPLGSTFEKNTKQEIYWLIWNNYLTVFFSWWWPLKIEKPFVILFFLLSSNLEFRKPKPRKSQFIIHVKLCLFVFFFFNKGVIGKDSYGKRYHIREPLGRDFGRLNFPSPDDYIPLVKQSRGAVFTLKAFVQNNVKWNKSLPLSLSKVLTQQIVKDQNQCKACTCEGRECKDVIDQRCL